jgi:hypothetical protein
MHCIIEPVVTGVAADRLDGSCPGSTLKKRSLLSTPPLMPDRSYSGGTLPKHIAISGPAIENSALNQE